jgi:hypothetical protein
MGLRERDRILGGGGGGREHGSGEEKCEKEDFLEKGEL